MSKDYDTPIVRCAERLVKKLQAGHCYRINGEFLKPVRDEIERMQKHCANKSNNPAQQEVEK